MIRDTVRALLLIGDEMGPPHGTPAARAAIAAWIGNLPWVEAEVTGDWDALLEERLAPFDVAVVCSGGRNRSSGEWRRHSCTDAQLAGLEALLARGGGLVGTHIATSNGHEGFVRLLGGAFVDHPPFGRFTVRVAGGGHPITDGLSARTYEVEDECYRVRVVDPAAIRVIMTSHYPDPEQKIDGEPSAWVREVGQGRVFYTALGHDERSWRQPAVREIAARGLAWAGQLGERSP